MIDNNKRLGKGEICSSPRTNNDAVHRDIEQGAGMRKQCFAGKCSVAWGTVEGDVQEEHGILIDTFLGGWTILEIW